MDELFTELYKKGFDVEVDLIQTSFRITLYDRVRKKTLATEIGESVECAFAKVLRGAFKETMFDGLSRL